ncbi:ribonuclease H2, subunit B [Chytridium lagenaria]|nr:ribonuclease H2, subunit B [Chytridium lagenaria]
MTLTDASQVRLPPNTKPRICLIYNPTDSNEPLTTITLPHPKTGVPVLFALNTTTETILEIHRLESSLDLNDHVTPIRTAVFGKYMVQDGNVYAFTPFDTLFMILPFWEKARLLSENGAGKWDEVETALYDERYPDLMTIAGWKGLPKLMEKICDVNDKVPGHTFFRLNDEKVVNWLEGKVNRVLSSSAKYECLRPPVQAQAQFSEEDLSQRRKITIARLVCGNLSAKWQSLLLERCNINDASKEYKYFMDIPMGRHNSDLEDKKENIEKPIKNQSAGVKRLAKASTKGMKTLNSFFQKK